eukprot:4929948-Pyramimonas_sp.AAC.1
MIKALCFDRKSKTAEVSIDAFSIEDDLRCCVVEVRIVQQHQLHGPVTAEAHAKKRPACLQGALGFLGFDSFAMERVTVPHQK